MEIINVSSLKFNPFAVCRVPGVPNCVPIARDSSYNSDLLRKSHFRARNSGLLTRSRHFAVNAIIDYEVSESVIVESEKNDRKKEVKPVYVPTPLNRDLRTPHSGYHFDRTTRKFFEGWYFKVTIPEKRQSFCFMYTVENPAFSSHFGAVDEVIHGHLFTGVGAQILGADDKYICQYSKQSKNFWGSRHELALGNTFVEHKGKKPPHHEMPPQEFNHHVQEGFQVTPFWHQGFICNDGSTSYMKTVKSARWEYSTRPLYGWGDANSKQKATAGWPAAFPVFEPHWQICMASGLSTGWIEWDGELFEFTNAPSYCEKNWGGGFPRKWFWVQCNAFNGAIGEISLTSGGGFRKLPGFGDKYEEVALIAVHYNGIFYEFVPWTGSVNWEIAPWGYWHICAENEKYKVEVIGTTTDQGSPIRAPTSESGLSVICRDTCVGDLRLQMWKKNNDGSRGEIILDVNSSLAALEVGGGPWFTTWNSTCTSPEILSRALRIPLDIESMYSFAPFLKPPGL